MELYFKSLGVERPTEEKVKKYVNENKSIELDGFNYKYLNAYQDKEKEAGLQIILNKNIETKKETISINHTNSCTWDFRILAKINNLEEDCYLIDNNVEGILNGSKSIATIKLVNKDILPSVLIDDVLKVQVSGFAEEIRFFSEENEPYQKFNYFKNKNENNKAYVASLLDTKSTQDNLIFANHVAIAGIVKEIYVYDFEMFDKKSEYYGAKIETDFGDLMIYFSEDNIIYCKRGSFKKGSIIECTVSLVGDVYLKREMLKIDYNKENTTRLFRRAFSEENFNYFENIISDDCIYKSVNFEINGKRNIIDKLNGLASNNKVSVTLRKCVITKVPENSELNIGDECMYYSQKGSSGHCLTYVRFDDSNKINYIRLLKTNGYSYKFDFPKKHIENLV